VKKDTLKYIGLVLIAVVLVFANTMMVYKTFFAKNRLNPDYKKQVEVTNADIRRYADSLFVHRDSLRIVEDIFESNKRIVNEKDNIIGYIYILYEPINCPSCSDINYVLITNKEYTIKNIILVNDIIEGFKKVPKDTINLFIKSFFNINILTYNFENVKLPKKSMKYQTYIQNSLINIKKQIKFFYEK